MSSSQSPDKKCSTADLKSHKGFEEGKLYEKLTLTLLVKRGYELSKRNSAFRHFSIGKEVSVSKDAKFDDIIFKYEDQDNTKNLIFVQIKHKQDDYKIDSQILSAEASTAKGGRDGGMRRDFNLQKYFISYLNDREQLKCTTCEELRNGKIKHVVLFTNAGLDTEDLIRNEFSLGEAPEDILKLFALKISSLRTPHPTRCIQLNSISEDLRKVLQKSSDLHRLARVLAGYVVWKNYREKNILGTDESPVKHCHLMLGKHVIEKSGHVKNISTGKKKKILYCDAKFKDDFIYSNEKGPKQELLKAIFEAVRELDTSKKNMSDGRLKIILKGVEFKVVSHFGKSKSEKKDLLDKWMAIHDDDINDFLKCLVFFVNQPSVTDLLTHMYSEKETFLEDTRLGKALDNMNPKFRDRIEKDLGIYEKDSYEKVWLSGETVFQFVQEQQEAVNVSIVTLIYEDEVMQYGRFNTLGKLTATLDSFLNYEKREHNLLRNILCIRTPMTLFSTIKILQYLNSTNYRETNGQISTKMIDLGSKEFRERIEKAFRSESHNLLTIECRHTISETFVNTFCDNLFDTIKRNPNKKIILIIQQNEDTILTEKFKSDLQNLFKRQPDVYVEETDDIKLQDFEPVENPLKKEIIVFQGQKQKLSLATLTGITNWNYFIDYLYQANIRNKQDVIDIMTLILTRDGLEIGSKPLGTSSLEGAYAKMSEEINVETLANKLLLLGLDNGADSATSGVCNSNNEIYIVSGIIGSNEQERIDKLIECLGQGIQKSKIVRNKKEFKSQLSYIVSVNKLQVVDDQFKDNNFYQLCHNYPEQQVFWICAKNEKNVSTFYIEQFYNPNFYLKRTFKIIEKIIIQKEIKELLIENSLSERFIFHCNTKDLMDCLNECEIALQSLQRNDKLMIFTEEDVAKATFEDMSRKSEVETVHWLKFEDEQIIWCNSHGSLSSLQMYINEKKNKISLVEEDNLIKSIKDRKILIISDDPGMGKTTTLTNLYESNETTNSILETHWVIKIHLKDQLESVRDTELLDGITDVDDVVKFLSKSDLNLSHNLSNILLRIALDKSKSFSKPLLLAFDGFDEVLDVEVRNKIISMFKFLKNGTAAKLWITTRLHYKQILENELSTFAIEFNPMTDQEKLQYIKKYLKKRLYLALKEEKYVALFGNNDKNKINKDIEIYIATLLNQMKSVFTGDIARFIGTPLQLSLTLEGSVRHFKNWFENGDGEIPVFNYLGDNAYDIYENFVARKYDVYFQKAGIRGLARQGLEKFNIDLYHKDFAVSKILEVNSNNDYEQFKDIFLLVGIIRSQGNDLEFIHKTFQEFFAAKVFFDWIKKAPETHKQEYLLKIILLKPDYQLVRTFINFQLEKLSEHGTNPGRQNEPYKSLEQYGNVAAELISKEISPLIDENGTPLHIAVKENNKNIAYFLLNSLRGHSDALRKFLFAAGECTTKYNRNCKETVLHRACSRDDVEIVKVLLNAAEGISDDTLQDFLKCLNGNVHNALDVAVIDTHNVQIFNELLSRSNNKLDLILNRRNALGIACNYGKQEFVDLLLQEFEHEKHSLKKLLLYSDIFGNALCEAECINIVEILISAAKSIEDNNETLKNLLLPEKGKLPFINAVWNGKMDIVEKLLKVAKEIENDNHTLKQLLLKKYDGESALRTAARRGYVDIIKLLLETASALGINHTMTKQLLLNETGGESALHVAVRDGRVDVVKVLLETACDLGIDDDNYTLKQLLLNEKYEESVLYAAVRNGHVDVIKMLLEKASDLGIDDDNYTLKQLLLKRRYGDSVLNVALENGHIDVIKMLLEKASDLGIDDDSHTLKQLLLKADNRLQRSALHVAAKCAGGDIIKLLLETASALGIEMLEKLITSVDCNGQNAIELMFENGKETLFIESLKTLEEDKYQNIRKKVMEMFDNVPLETRLYFHKKMLIKAIKRNDIKKVKDILIKVKNSSINHNESLRILLLEDESFSRNILSIACEEGYSEIIKELLSCAKEIDDDNHTLKQLILNKTSGASSLHFAVENGHPDVITLLLKTASDSGIDMLEEITDIKRKNLGFDLIYECGMVNEYGCDTLKRMLLRLKHVIEEWGFFPLDNCSLLESRNLFSEEDVD